MKDITLKAIIIGITLAIIASIVILYNVQLYKGLDGFCQTQGYNKTTDYTVKYEGYESYYVVECDNKILWGWKCTRGKTCVSNDKWGDCTERKTTMNCRTTDALYLYNGTYRNKVIIQ